MFIDGLLTVGMGSRQRLPVKNAAKSKLQLLHWSSAPVYPTGGSALGLVLMRHCGLLLESLLFLPWCCWDEPEIALDNVCAKFYYVYICHKNDLDLLCVLFSVLLNISVTIIVIITLNRERGSVDYYESTAWALQKPRTCQGMWSCVCTLLSSVQPQTARVKKHNCSSFSKLVLNWLVCQRCLWTSDAQYLLIFAPHPLMSYWFLHDSNIGTNKVQFFEPDNAVTARITTCDNKCEILLS